MLTNVPDIINNSLNNYNNNILNNYVENIEVYQQLDNILNESNSIKFCRTTKIKMSEKNSIYFAKVGLVNIESTFWFYKNFRINVPRNTHINYVKYEIGGNVYDKIYSTFFDILNNIYNDAYNTNFFIESDNTCTYFLPIRPLIDVCYHDIVIKVELSENIEEDIYLTYDTYELLQNDHFDNLFKNNSIELAYYESYNDLYVDNSTNYIYNNFKLYINGLCKYIFIKADTEILNSDVFLNLDLLEFKLIPYIKNDNYIVYKFDKYINFKTVYNAFLYIQADNKTIHIGAILTQPMLISNGMIGLYFR